MRAITYFIPLFGRLRGPLLLALGLSLVTIAAGVGLLGVSGWFLTAAALTSAGVAFNLFAPSAGVRGFSFVRILSRYGEKVTGHDATLRLLSDLRRTTFANLFRLVPLNGLFGRADLVSRLVADLDALDTVFLVGVGPIATATVTGIGMAGLLAYVLPPAAPLYAAGYAIAALGVPVMLVGATRRVGRNVVSASAALRGVVLDGMDGHQDLVLFDAIDRTALAAQDAAAQLALARSRLGRYSALASAAVQAISALVLIATLLCGLSALGAHRIEGPLLVGVLLAVVASFEASAAVVRGAKGIAAAAAAAERLADLALAPPQIEEPATPKDLPEGGKVVFDGVHFGYGRRSTVLDGLSLQIAAGECVAIKGLSGSGKSTIARLLVRLIDPAAGRIVVNGCDVREVSSAQLRERVALMTQEAPVFNDTVRANLAIGRPGAPDDALWAMLGRVRLADAVRALPKGLDTVLGEAGRSLSAGQARRICLARTLLSGAPIVVLDEPTTGLDHEAEQEFLADIPALSSGRTMMVITHADVPANFGRTLELRAGRIA